MADNDDKFAMIQAELDRRFATQDKLREDLKELLTIKGGVFAEKYALLQEEIDRRFDAMERVSIARLGNIGSKFDDNTKLLDERYQTQTKALDKAFSAAEQAVQVALANAEKAVQKAEVAADKRFDSVNEFRQTLTDQTASFPTREEVRLTVATLNGDTARNTERVSDLELRMQGITAGQAGSDKSAHSTQQMITIGISVIALIVSIVLAIVLIVNAGNTNTPAPAVTVTSTP